jgi:phage-related protein
MTYPILPLTPTWGNTEQEVADVAKTKYGEAGVEQRDFIGINPLTTSWDINVNIRNFQEVDDFLRSRRGKPFRLSLDGGVSDDGKFYICTEWQIQQLGVGVGNFSANINQVRRFLPPLFRVVCLNGYLYKGKVLEFLPLSYGTKFTFSLNYAPTHIGYGTIQVHKWINIYDDYNDFFNFSNRIWIKEIQQGDSFSYTPTQAAKYLSFSQYNPYAGPWDTPYFDISNNIILLDGF